MAGGKASGGGAAASDWTLLIHTRQRTVEMRPPSGLAATWHLRLVELVMTRVDIVFEGRMLKAKPAPSSSSPNTADDHGGVRHSSGSGGGGVHANRFEEYWFALYSNGALLYFSDEESAHLGQARGILNVETRSQPHAHPSLLTSHRLHRLSSFSPNPNPNLAQARGILDVESVLLRATARHRLAAGDRVLVGGGQRSTGLEAVVVREIEGADGQPRFKVHLNEAGSQVDASPSTLRYWYDGAEHEPAVCVNERGVASQLTLVVSSATEQWQLGLDSAEDCNVWFEAFNRYKTRTSVASARRQLSVAPSDPVYADVLLARGWLDVRNAAVELEEERAGATRSARRSKGEMRGGDVADNEADDSVTTWTTYWFALRPSGLHLYTSEQSVFRPQWDAPAFSLSMSSVVAATAASGSDFYRAIFILQRADGRELTCHAASRLEMRSLLGLLNLQCQMRSGAEIRSAEAVLAPRSVSMAGWLL